MKKALLAVSFGTSYRETLEKTIARIEADLAAALPERTLFRAFTSGMILRKLERRDGLHIDDVPQALARLAAEGYEDVLIQPTHILNGDEYDKLCAQAAPWGEKFARLAVGRPLLTAAEDYRAAFAQVDAILMPATPHAAFRHGEISDPTQMYLSDMYTISLNIAGNGGIVVPVGLGEDTGLPMAAQLVAPAFADERLVTYAAAIERGLADGGHGASVLGVAPAFAGKGGELA